MVTTNISNYINGIRKSTSFLKKNHVFILSTITNNLNEIYYTFEIQANIPLDYTSKYISHSSLLKIKDVLSKLNNSLDLELRFEIIT